MATKKKMLQAAAGNAGGAGLDITEVFSTYLYDGTGATQTITNGIDLAGEGGLVWMKNRDAATNHRLYTTDLYSGSNSNLLQTNLTTGGSNTGSFELESFNSDGFTLGYSGGAYSESNGANTDYASWTFRKAPKFFDVVTYTGDGTGNRIISHGLNSTPGMLVVRPYDAVSDWFVNHRGNGTAGLKLNTTDATAFSPVLSLDGNLQWDSTTVTLKTNFNNSGVSYVAYVFAHNDGDGEFGPDGDQDIIKCGSFSGETTINLGWEPQWVMVKRTDSSSNGEWLISDNMRGWVTAGGRERFLAANSSDREGQDSGDGIYSNSDSWEPTSTGFKTFGFPFSSSGTYIYMAIRRGPLAQPESGTEVFDVDAETNLNTFVTTPWPTDLAIQKDRQQGNQWVVIDRMRGGSNILDTSSNSAENTNGTGAFFSGMDYMDGIDLNFFSSDASNNVVYNWKRASGYFDVVAYSGSTSTQNISHNLGVQPEMIWIKNRSFSGTSWPVLFTSLGARKYLNLNTTDAAITLPLFNGTDFFANTLPTSSVFTVGGGNAGGGYDDVGSSGSNYIAYLFATLPGVSKVGSYTGNGSSQTIDCGFTSGARFVLIKKTSNTGHWIVFDTVRGIVSGVDPFLKLNNTDAENTGHDAIDPDSSGFIINESGGAFNVNNETYIFYAIA